MPKCSHAHDNFLVLITILQVDKMITRRNCVKSIQVFFALVLQLFFIKLILQNYGLAFIAHRDIEPVLKGKENVISLPLHLARTFSKPWGNEISTCFYTRVDGVIKILGHDLCAGLVDSIEIVPNVEAKASPEEELEWSSVPWSFFKQV